MRKILAVGVVGIGLMIGSCFLGKKIFQEKEVAPPQATPVPTPLASYAIENLAKTEQEGELIQIGEKIKADDDFESYLFSHAFRPAPYLNETKIVTGLINIPTAEELFPVVVMIRGYVDQEIYQTGVGTRKAAEVFAENGLITVAPDFLGYGESDREAKNIFESRFQTYTTALSILNSVESIDKWDRENVFIWAHSNGGQIALTILAATGAEYPTTLWAPVTKPFPYNILYFTDESEDGGKLIRAELAKVEALYDVDLFSFNNYLERIRAPLQIHQGTADEAVPVEWNDGFVKKLDQAEIENKYLRYGGVDHNMVPVWDRVVERDLEFFEKNLKDPESSSG
jgi:dipeptidyl aminopeptidase/acylaminoacyl peptidase